MIFNMMSSLMEKMKLIKLFVRFALSFYAIKNKSIAVMQYTH